MFNKIGFKSIAITLAVSVALITSFSSFIIIDAGEKVRVRNNATGNVTWHVEEGVQFKAPFMSTVNRYNTVTTIAITNVETIADSASQVLAPMGVSFADNYGGKFQASFRLKLPTSDVQLEAMHQDVKGQSNLEGNTYVAFVNDMINLTTDQFLAQDYMQGGKGAFKQRLYDQGQNGMLITAREKVEIAVQQADQTKEGERKGNVTGKQFITKVVIKKDKNGVPLRRPHSLSKYGISVAQVDLGTFSPDKDLENYISKIKERERERGQLIAMQSLERDKAVTEQLTGERERITAKNKALILKDRETIQGQKQVELAKIQAEREIVERDKVAALAVIDKNRELQVAEANEGIQRANAVAAGYQAKSIKLVGFAEAAVKKADYQAVDKEILALEVDKAKAIALYSTKMVVNMPAIVGGTGKEMNSIEQMSSLKLLEQLGKPVK